MMGVACVQRTDADGGGYVGRRNRPCEAWVAHWKLEESDAGLW